MTGSKFTQKKKYCTVDTASKWKHQTCDGKRAIATRDYCGEKDMRMSTCSLDVMQRQGGGLEGR
jgi:hypothetical protein